MADLADSLSIDCQPLMPLLAAGCPAVTGAWPAEEVGRCLAEGGWKVRDIPALNQSVASGAGGEITDLRRQGIVRQVQHY
jgi:hypothetical protein